MVEDETPVVVANVTKRFGPVTAVGSVSWAPRRGRVTALVGLNGAGKSTLLRIMTGLTAPTEGSVLVTAGRGDRRLSAMIEAPALFGGLSVRRNLRVHCVLTGAGRAEAGVVAELARVGDVLDRRVGTLSQGYRQRVAIAVALLRSPDVLLLDEPTNALDPEAIVQVRELVRRVADRGAAVVVSSHLLRELEGVADDLTVLHEGQVRYDGPFASFVGPTVLRVRAGDAEATGRLVELLHANGIHAEGGADGIRVRTDGTSPDRVAERVSGVAGDARIGLLELSHRTPSLEEAFHIAISGGHR